MTEWGLRARVLLSDYFAVAVGVAVVVALLGGWLVYTTHVDPGATTEPEVQGTWQSTAEYDHAATVTEENRVFPVGSTLDGRSTYFTRLSPELEGAFVYGFDGASGELDVQAESTLVIRSVGEGDGNGGDGRGGEVYWAIEEPLGNASGTLSPGEELEVPFVVNVSEVRAEIDDVESDLGASPGQTEVFVRSAVTAEGEAVGGPAEHADEFRLSISPGADTYGVQADGGTDQHQQVEPVTREVQHGPARGAGGPLLLLLGLASLGGLVVARSEGLHEVSERERRALELENEREEFDDWISRGSVQADEPDGRVVEIATLEDLVDVAIDADSRVIEDTDDDRYYVLDGDVRYEYARPPDATR